MTLTREQIEIIIEVFEEHADLLSDNSMGTLMSEEWELYYLLKENLNKNETT